MKFNHVRQLHISSISLAVLLSALGIPFAPHAQAQTGSKENLQAATARLAEPVSKPVLVTADGINWSCRNEVCTSTPIATGPNIEQCRALALKLNMKIASLARKASALRKLQLKKCNTGINNKARQAGKNQTANKVPNGSGSGVARAPVVRPLPNITIQAKPAPAGVAQPSPAIRKALEQSLAAGEAQSNPQSGPVPSAIEEGAIGTYTLYAQSPQTLSFHGQYTGSYPPDDRNYPLARWRGNVLRLQGLNHTGQDHQYERRIPNRGTLPRDSVLSARSSGSFVEIPLAFSNIPEQVYALSIECLFGVIPNRTGQQIYGPFSAQNSPGKALGTFWMRDQQSDGDWSLNTIARLPINLDQFTKASHLKTVGCSMQAYIGRIRGNGYDIMPLARAIDRRNPDRVLGFPAGADANSVLEVRADVEQ